MNSASDLTLKLSRDLAHEHRLGLAELAAFVARGRFPGLEGRILRSIAAGLLADDERVLAALAEHAAGLWERVVAP